MDAELSRSLFTRARERYESAGRIAFLTVFALLIFHITTFHPFIDATTRLDDVKAKTEGLNTLNQEIALLQDGLEQLERDLRTQMNRAINRALEHKIADFAELNRIVADIRSERPDEEVLTADQDPQMQMNAPHIQTQRPPEMQVQSQMQPQMQVQSQMPGETNPSTDALPQISDSLAAEIKQARSNDALRTLLLPYVRENIINRRFDALNIDLRKLHGQLSPDATELGNATTQFAENNPEFSDQFAKINTGLQTFVAALNEIHIEPPEDDNWWTSVQSKTATLDQLGAGAENELARYLNRQLSEHLGSELDVAIEQQEIVRAAITEEITALEKQFESQQEQMQSLSGFIKWGMLSLQPVANKFPLLLAVILAAVSLIVSRRIHETALAIQAMPEVKDGLFDWYTKRIGGLSGSFSLGKLPVQESAYTLGGIAWCALASWQVSRWSEVGFTAWIMFALGAVALVYAGWYRWQTVQAVAEMGSAK